jgi:hypothetical protein
MRKLLTGTLVFSAMLVLSAMIAALTIFLVVGSAQLKTVDAQAQGAYTTQPAAASNSPAGSSNAASSCADSDSWCKYCAQHLNVASCSTYAPGNGIASATGGVDPSNASAGGAGGGDGGGY